MKITCLTKRWNHHSPSSGYDHLGAAVSAKLVERQALGQIATRFGQAALSRLTVTPAGYQFVDWLAEIRVLSTSLAARPDIVHALYGDDQLDWLLRLRPWLRYPLVATFHLPPDSPLLAEKFEGPQRYAARRLDAAIVVCRSQIARFQAWLGSDKVTFVPHGIDTTAFSPGAKPTGQRPLHVAVVGQHMRDWRVLRSAINEVHHRRLPVCFDVVTSDGNSMHVAGCDNVSLHCGISEARLIELYRSADAVLIPVTDATANNSVLEALACGTPVISTSVGGMTDYVNGDCGWLFDKGDSESVVRLLESMCANRDLVESRREKARSQALRFSWPAIAERILAVYAAVLAGAPLAQASAESELGFG